MVSETSLDSTVPHVPETTMTTVMHINITRLNSLAPGRCDSDFKSITSKYMLQIKFISNSCKIALRWMPQITFDDTGKSSLVLVAWCSQATSHYLSQCWPQSMSPYGVTRPQWVKCVNKKCSTITAFILVTLSIKVAHHFSGDFCKKNFYSRM